MNTDPDTHPYQLPLLEGILLEPKTAPHACDACKGVAAPSSGDPAPSRHWLLDHYIGRDVLLAQLQLGAPQHAPAWYVLRAPGLDEKLEPLIALLGMRQVPQPTTYWDELKASIQLMWIFVALQCRLVWFAWTELLRRGTR